MRNRANWGATIRRMVPVVLSAVSFALAVPAAAQVRPGMESIIGNPGEPPHLPPARTGFNLFALADLAGTGLNMSGRMNWAVSNYGPCSEGTLIYQVNGCGQILGTAVGGTQSPLFELVFGAGAPISQFRKIRTVYPGVNAMRGPPGYTSLTTHIRVGAGSVDWGPADGTLGNLFAGVTSTTDGSCRDNSGFLDMFMNANVSLLAGSDCPPTWANGRFDGPRVIQDSAFIRQFNANPNRFSFDHWKVPVEERSSKLLGDFSTYGLTTDHYLEAIRAYGSVTPKGPATPPSRNGFPLGLAVYFEAYSFARPTLANVAFYQILIVNRSEDVYGAPIDYDSLYFGVMPGYLRVQSTAVYAEAGRNAVLTNESGTVPGCRGGLTPPGVNACSNVGFQRGAFGTVVLKSPIGDTRNKLLSRAGPFYNPTSPFADDTITFNHSHHCGFGGCWATTFNQNDRRGFGMLSSTEENTLDGRNPGGLTAVEHWRIFRAQAHPVQVGRYNRWVPGNWDFNEDGVSDTLFYDSCAASGCVQLWGDTMPGKQVNAYANIGTVISAGPFSLQARDTTSFVFAFVGGIDSSSFEAAVNDAIASYMEFYVGAEAPPVPVITAVDVASAQERDPLQLGPRVTLFFSDLPERWVDPFFIKYANDIRFKGDQFFQELRTFNPTLADTITARASRNFAELYIFKSCDGGATFTGDADCDGDPLVGPTGTFGVGWQPYAILRTDASGQIPNSFTDNNVFGGGTFLYSLVTRSRGFRIPVRLRDPSDASTACQNNLSACRTIASQLVVSDTVSSTIQGSGPSTARVYVPISLPAGNAAASFATSNTSGNATVPIDVTVSERARTGNFRLVFGNRFIVTIRTDLRSGDVTSEVRVQDIVARANRNGTPDTNVVVREDVLSGPGRLDFAGTTFAPTVTTVDSIRTERQVISGLGFVLAQGNIPYFLSLNGTTPEGFANRADFPGVLLTFSNSATALGTIRRERIVRATNDTVSVGVMNANALQYQEAVSVKRLGQGLYTYLFQADAFGPDAPFPFSSPDSLSARLSASLARRPAATVADTSARIRAIVGAAVPAYDSLPFVAARFPFTLTTSTGNPVILAMPRRTALPGGRNDLVLGTGNDTARVPIPDSLWMPGDRFVILEVIQRPRRSATGDTVYTDAAGQPILVTDTVVAFGPTVLGCNTPRESCNPIVLPGRGATGYLPYQNNWKLIVEYPVNFTEASEVALSITATEGARTFSQTDLNRVRVVPNPYIVQSAFDRVDGSFRGESRIIFAGVPASGSMRIYSVSGQFLQQLIWTASDLIPPTTPTSSATITGDLAWNLRTREGTDLSSGLYIYVLQTTDASGRKMTKRGKFVVIR